MHPQLLFNKLFPDQQSVSSKKEMMTQLSKKYPYFGPLYFYWLSESSITDEGYENIAAKAALFFSNPYLLHSQLLKTKEKSLLVEAAETIKVDANQPDTPIFEPLFSTDYFASQGIKLSEEVKANDKLGKQLKSFTEWLKTTKKTSPNYQITDKEPEIDKNVEKMAEKSNRETEVITESLAEIYIQQGKKHKALEIYKKLSLQFPSKNAYFAQKIKSI